MNYEQIAEKYPAYKDFPYGTIVQHKDSGEQARVIGFSDFENGMVDLEVPISGGRRHPVSQLTPIA